MSFRFRGQSRYVQAAKNNFCSDRLEASSQPAGFISRCGQGRDRDRIEIGRQIFEVDVAHFQIFHRDVERRHSRQGQQTETGQCFDRVLAPGNTWEGKAKVQQLHVAKTETAHGDESDFHCVLQFISNIRIPAAALSTGKGKRIRNRGRQAPTAASKARRCSDARQ